MLVGSAEECLVGKTSLRRSERTHITPDKGERIESATNSGSINTPRLVQITNRQMFCPSHFVVSELICARKKESFSQES